MTFVFSYDIFSYRAGVSMAFLWTLEWLLFSKESNGVLGNQTCYDKTKNWVFSPILTIVSCSSFYENLSSIFHMEAETILFNVNHANAQC